MIYLRQMTMIRERLREMEMKITELADYLHITRPTLYKFIENYDAGDNEGINKNVLSLFDYIENNPLAGKKTVINYILTNLVSEKEMCESAEVAKYSKVKKYITNNANSIKTRFIELLIAKDDFDDIVPYLVKIEKVLGKRKLTKKEETLLKPYKAFVESIEEEEK